MLHRSVTTALLLCMTIGFAKPTPVSATREGLRLKIATVLGVEKEIYVTQAGVKGSSSAELDEHLAHILSATFQNRAFLVRLAADVYIAVPFQSVRALSVDRDTFVVEPIHGNSVRGRCLSMLLSESGDRYECMNLREARLLEPGTGLRPRSSPAESRRWELETPNTPKRIWEVTEIAFAWPYYSTRGYVRGGTMRFDGRDTGFLLKLGAGESDAAVRVNLQDYREVHFRAADEKERAKTWSQMQATTVAPNGTTVSGGVGFETEGGRAFWRFEWLLTARTGEGGNLLMLRLPTCRLRQL